MIGHLADQDLAAILMMTRIMTLIADLRPVTDQNRTGGCYLYLCH